MSTGFKAKVRPFELKTDTWLLNTETDSYPLTTLRAVFKILIQHFATTPACPWRFGFLLGGVRPKSLAGLGAAVTHGKGFAFFDSEYGNKK